MSFSRSDQGEYLAQHDLPDTAKAYLLAASAGPSRDVGTTTYRSVVSEYPSRKMGTSIATESRTGELAYAIHLEYNDLVRAYYEQPPAVDCVRTDRKGRRGARLYHPDFLVLGPDGPVVVQVKPEEVLQRKVLENPTDWIIKDGRIRDLPADKAFAELGLRHEVISSSELPRIRVANLQLLLLTRNSGTHFDEVVRKRILRLLDRNAVMRVSDLAQAAAITDLTPILALIDDNMIHTRLDTMLLSQPDSCWVAKTAALLLPGRLDIDGLLAQRPQVASTSIATVPPRVQTERALKILEVLETSTPERSASRYRKAIAECQARGISPFLAVVPKTFNSGNRTRKRPALVLEFAESVVCSEWAHVSRLTPASAFRLYKARAHERHPGVKHVSRPTFARLIDLHRQAGAHARGGTRAGNAAESPTDVEGRALKPMRPFELATCDHYKGDVFCIVLRTGKWIYVQQPWITVLRDCATGYILSIWISFKPPSRFACAMVVRSCLRRHGRLPEAIVVDRGADFRSVYFGSLLAHCGITMVMRPSSHPRYGSEAERFFGDFKDRWLNLRPGNTAVHVEARAVSSTHAASALAHIELVDLFREIWQFSDWLGQIPSNGSGIAPRIAFDDGLKQFPQSGVQLPYDNTFLIASAVDEREISLDIARGLRVGDFWYWSPLLARPGLHANKITIRRDPEDHCRVYAKIDDRWETCFSSKHPVAAAKDPLVALCDAIIALSTDDARAAAADNADIELVRQVELADQRVNAILAPTAERPLPTATPDAFEALHEVDVDSLGTSTWESP